MRSRRSVLRNMLLVFFVLLLVGAVSTPLGAEDGDSSLFEGDDSLEASSEILADTGSDEGDAEFDGATLEETDTSEDSEINPANPSSAEGPEDGGGSVDVSLPTAESIVFTGAATAKIPILVPPGRGGMAPDLNLTYNSYRRGNGWLGVGWDLDLGAIQRSMKRGVSYGSDDFVSVMDGSYTELVRRPDWGPNHYGAKIEEAFSKYHYNPSTGGWEVTTKGGIRYYYRTTPGSRQSNARGVFKWCLDRSEDTNGNYMTVEYLEDQGEIYLHRIDYSGNGTLAPSNGVRFYCEGRPDPPISYNTISRVVTACRLKTIEVMASGTRVRAYRLQYAASAATSRSLLTTVQQFGTDAVLDESGTVVGGTSLPEVDLGYTPESVGGFSTTEVSSYGSFDANIRFVDVNGDGLSDLVRLPDSGQRVWVYLNLGNGQFSRNSTDTLLSIWYTQSNYPVRALADVNGDGLADLLFAGLGVRAFLGLGNGQFSTDYISSYGSFNANTRLADVNGDGLSDLVRLPDSGQRVWVYLNLGNA